MLKLSKALDIVLHPKTGKYAKASKNTKENVPRHLRIACDRLSDPYVGELKHAHYRKLWRMIATEHKNEGTFGKRAAEQMIAALRASVTWLADHEYVEEFGLPKRNWREQLADDWKNITGDEAKTKSLRYTKDEVRKLHNALSKAEPRLRLAFDIGAETFIGQFIHVKRSDVVKHAGHELGAIMIPASGKKKPRLWVLEDKQRLALEAALHDGFLSQLETAYHKGRLDDFRLVPGEFLAKGKAQVKNAMRPISGRALGSWWKSLENAAGVEHERGRRWDGLRRRAIEDAKAAPHQPSAVQTRPFVDESRIAQLKTAKSRDYESSCQ